MPSPTVTHVICIGALILLILSVQTLFLYVVDNSWEEMAKRELMEVTDGVADTVANLYFLVNSTKDAVSLQKTLSLPSSVEGSGYVIQITRNASTTYASSVKGYFVNKSCLFVESWLPPGLTFDRQRNVDIDHPEKSVIAGCQWNGTHTCVWMAYG